uniref:Uncharacterized protein n=1 Tax=Heterorhabditis bacteriophora TaxID=37862 RepID=A0A1I7WK76_HETBA
MCCVLYIFGITNSSLKSLYMFSKGGYAMKKVDSLMTNCTVDIILDFILL